MRVERLDAFLVDLPFRFTFGHALAARASSTNVIVAITLDDGTIGYGEGVPREYVTGETPCTALDRVIHEYGPKIVGRDLPRTYIGHQLRHRRDEIHADTAPPAAAWCAVETALLDAIGRSVDQPVAELLGGAARTSVQYGGVVPFGNGPALAGMLLFFRVYGFSDVKLKLGRSAKKDLATVKLARRILGPSVELRADANCAWTVEETLRMAARLRPFGIRSYEQPIPAHDVAGLARLTATLPEDIVVDESLCSVEDARQLADARACNVFNVRVSKCGGPLAALEVVRIAHDAGLACQLGAQVGESGILTATGRLVATLARPAFRHHEGADNLFLLRRDLTVENVTAGRGGRGDMPPGSGLGLHVDSSSLRMLTRRRDSIDAPRRHWRTHVSVVDSSVVGG
jgi:L-alanine-DL-glutamate epimerase-like enolase superfamily enzyme